MIKKKPRFKKKTRSLSIKTKLLLPSLSTLIIVSVILCLYIYNSMQKNLIYNAINISNSLATISSNTISGTKLADYFTQLKTTDDMKKPQYNQIGEQLNKISKNSTIKYIYTLYIENGDLYYGVDPDEDINTKCMPGELFEYDDDSKPE